MTAVKKALGRASEIAAADSAHKGMSYRSAPSTPLGHVAAGLRAGAAPLPSGAARPPALACQRVNLYARVRPFIAEDGREATCTRLQLAPASSSVVVLPLPRDAGSVAAPPQPNLALAKRFTLDGVHGGEVGQAEVYHACAVGGAVGEALDGVNAVVCVYGQTGSGKSFSVFGPDTDANAMGAQDASLLGLVPRAIHDLFERVHVREGVGVDFSVSVRALQLYQDTWFDLLAPAEAGASVAARRGTSSSLKQLPSIVPERASLHSCSDVRSVLALLTSASRRKAVAATAMNSHSSRGHTVFQAVIVRTSGGEGGGGGALDVVRASHVSASSLTFFDLAGSERLKRSRADGVALTEARFINKSLHTLGVCMAAVASCALRHGEERGPPPFVPWRSSKLTRFLQSCLAEVPEEHPSSRATPRTCLPSSLTLLVCLSPTDASVAESTSSLIFATRARAISEALAGNDDEGARTLLDDSMQLAGDGQWGEDGGMDAEDYPPPLPLSVRSRASSVASRGEMDSVLDAARTQIGALTAAFEALRADHTRVQAENARAQEALREAQARRVAAQSAELHEVHTLKAQLASAVTARESATALAAQLKAEAERGLEHDRWSAQTALTALSNLTSASAAPLLDRSSAFSAFSPNRALGGALEALLESAVAGGDPAALAAAVEAAATMIGRRDQAAAVSLRSLASPPRTGIPPLPPSPHSSAPSCSPDSLVDLYFGEGSLMSLTPPVLRPDARLRPAQGGESASSIAARLTRSPGVVEAARAAFISPPGALSPPAARVPSSVASHLSLTELLDMPLLIGEEEEGIKHVSATPAPPARTHEEEREEALASVARALEGAAKVVSRLAHSGITASAPDGCLRGGLIMNRRGSAAPGGEGQRSRAGSASSVQPLAQASAPSAGTNGSASLQPPPLTAPWTPHVPAALPTQPPPVQQQKPEVPSRRASLSVAVRPQAQRPVSVAAEGTQTDDPAAASAPAWQPPPPLRPLASLFGPGASALADSSAFMRWRWPAPGGSPPSLLPVPSSGGDAEVNLASPTRRERAAPLRGVVPQPPQETPAELLAVVQAGVERSVEAAASAHASAEGLRGSAAPTPAPQQEKARVLQPTPPAPRAPAIVPAPAPVPASPTLEAAIGPSPLRSPVHVRSLGPLRGLVGSGAAGAGIDPTPVPTPQRIAYPFPVRPLASCNGPGARLPGDVADFSTPASGRAPYVQPHFTPSRGTSPARLASSPHTPRTVVVGRGQSNESKDEAKLTEALLSTRATLGRALTAVKEAMERQAPQVAAALPERVPEAESVSPPPDPPVQPFESSITDLLRMTAGLSSPAAVRELQRRAAPTGGLSGSRFRTVGISPPSSEDEGAAPTTAAARVALYRSLINGAGRPLGRPTEAIIRAARDNAAELLKGLGTRAPPPMPAANIMSPILAAPAPLTARLPLPAALASPSGGSFGTLQTGAEGAEGGASPPPPTPSRQDKPRGRSGRASREETGEGTPGRLFMVTVPNDAVGGPAGIPVFVKGTGVVLMQASMLAAMGVRVDASHEAEVLLTSSDVRR